MENIKIFQRSFHLGLITEFALGISNLLVRNHQDIFKFDGLGTGVFSPETISAVTLISSVEEALSQDFD